MPERLHETGGQARKAAPVPSRVSVRAVEGQALNGLGMMLLQYLEQNLDEFEQKAKAALRLRGRFSVEVEKGIATTLSFRGDTIEIENGVGRDPDLHLQSSYLLLSRILSGKANPYLEVVRGNIKLRAFPRRPIRSLKVLGFLKIPPELLLEPLPSKKWTYITWAAGLLLGLGGIGLLLYGLLQVFGG